MNYFEFLKTKRIRNYNRGINEFSLSEKLFNFQHDITSWALRKGRCALFLDTGLGKTHCQTEWARCIGGTSLIVAPLSVARQTVRMAKKVTNTDVKYCRNDKDVVNGINITNYENIHNFNSKQFNSVVLDESSILKSIDGSTRKLLTEMFYKTEYKLCCTATPSPNDNTEIGNHAEFLGVMKMNEMLATFFVHANIQTETIHKKENGEYFITREKESACHGQEWRLKNHAHDKFYQWLSTWGMFLKSPTDLGYKIDGFDLPKLNIIPHFIESDVAPEGQLFFIKLSGISNRVKIRKATIDKKIELLKTIIDDKKQWVIWCNLNSESNIIHHLFKESVELTGTDDAEFKAKTIEDFQDGKIRILITKPKISGFGLNLQNSHNAVFFGLSDSWESYYQCIRRQWRYGQKNDVNIYIVLTSQEKEIYDNVMNKEATAKRMSSEMIKRIKIYEEAEMKGKDEFVVFDSDVHESGENWIAINGDSCQQLPKLKSDSIDMSVYSPPFADLYTYSNSDLDLGNSRDWTEFFKHYSFIIKEIFRLTKKGRISCVHTSDIPALASKDGYIGVKDFPGEVIRAHQKEGWIYHGWAVVAKNPQQQAIRTHSKALLFVQFKKDSSDSRPCILDRILFFKKPGDSEVPISPVINGEADNEAWIDWAGGIWTGIHESDVLKYQCARDKDDEKHICPLQLGTIERCLKLYSNPGETILTPFLGIGSEAYQAIKYGRKAIGIELKPGYFKTAISNLRELETKIKQPSLLENLI